jgi:FixJ family two-component response regulator
VTPIQGDPSLSHTFVVAIVDDLNAVRHSTSVPPDGLGEIEWEIGGGVASFDNFPDRSRCVLLDLRLAGLDGRGVLRAIGRALAPSGDDKVETIDPKAVAKVNSLTNRQVQVLRGVVGGQPNKIIAYELGLSVRTVETYRAQLLDKLGVRGTAEAVRLAMAAGII